MLDEATIERIVREVVRRLLERNPDIAGVRVAQGSTGVVHHHDRVLTEFDLISARRTGRRVVSISRKTIITPLARDRARDLGIELRFRDS